MEILNKFKKTLIENHSVSSKDTLKNYLSDVRKFISWYENSYKKQFPPPVISQEQIESYLSTISLLSPRSAKRYRSSLRKFFSFMLDQKLIPNNPLLTIQNSGAKTDVWHLKDFSNYLYNSKSSNHTIKNYITDVKNFFYWIERTKNDENVLRHIDTFMIEVYKNHLLNEESLSPVSVNRKLSSLRKYISWGISKGVIKPNTEVAGSINTPNNSTAPAADSDIVNDLSLSTLQALQSSQRPAEDINEKQNSRFGPIRLFNQTKNAANTLFDSLVVLSVLKSVEAVKYNLWKNTGKEIFIPLSSLLKQNSLEGQIKPTPETPNINTSIDKFIAMGEFAKLTRLKGIPKSIYAPSKVSTSGLSFWKRLEYNIKYVRPKWYKIYHSYAFSHYLHFGIALIFATFAGFTLFKAFTNVTPQRTVLASRVAPGRLISFQGRLNDLANNPINHESPVKFAIYSSQTASESALLWQEQQMIVPDQAGNFSTILGQNTKLSQDIFVNNPHLYLGISIGADPELSPRLELASAGLTQSAEELQGLKPITGNNVGTSNVILALDSSGNLTIGGSSAPIFQATGGEFKLSGQQLTLGTNIGSNTNVVLNPDGAGIIDIRKPLQNTSNNNNLQSALGAVEVDDNFAILASTSAQSALVISQNSTGDLISATTGGIAKFTLTNQGSGIFAGDISIIGNNLTTTASTFNLANTNTLSLNIGSQATSISLGSASGITTINNNLKVSGILNANGGINLPLFAPGSIPFINSLNQLAEDRTSFFWDVNNKRLGIGTSTPTYKISAIDNASGPVAAITNTSSADSPSTSVLRLNTGVSASGTQARFITFYAGCSAENCSGTGVGNIHQVAGGIALQSGTADFAERLNVPESTEPGDVIGTNTTNNRKSISGDSLLGVVSDSAIVIGNSPENIDKTANPIVGLLGQVRTKVGVESGPIKKGDFLTSSNTPGVAKKATNAGQALGTALEDFSGPGIQRILVLVRPGWYQPEAVLNTTGNVNLLSSTESQNPDPKDKLSIVQNYKMLDSSVQDFINTLKIGVLEAGHISTQSLSIATDDISVGGQTLRDYLSSIVNDIVDKKIAENNKKQISILSPVSDTTFQPSPTIPQPSPTPLIATLSAIPTKSITNITNIYNNISSASANLTSTNPSPSITPSTTASLEGSISPTPETTPAPLATPSATSLSSSIQSSSSALTKNDITNIQYAKVASYSAELAYIPNLKSDFATLNNGLISLGPTSLTDTSINGQLAIGSSMKLSENSINAIGADLSLQPLRQGNLSFMGGLVAIDTEGNLTVNGNATFARDLKVKGKFAAGLIVPVPNQDLILQTADQENSEQGKIQVKDASGSGVLSINHLGDLISSGSGKFANLKIVRGAQADTSFTETVASGSAGTATITAHETERTIITPFVNAESLIYLTPVSNVQGSTPYIARQVIENKSSGSKGSFTIQISSLVAQDIKINWWIVN